MLKRYKLKDDLLRMGIIAGAILVMVGCRQVTAPLEPVQVTGTQEEIPASPTEGDETPVNPALPALQKLIEQAKEDLAQRLSISISDISLVEAKEVTWPDGSLGCPQPGMLYTQVLTPGYLIKLKYDSRDFEYHVGKIGAPTYCENPTPPVEGMPVNT